jgi:2-polyprenyl-3-methyl-5-hydroxy-6-metoxy-1,4-benzoquinol methylase
MEFARHTHCLVCESKQLEKIPRYYEANGLIRCCNCRFVFMERIPSLQELSDHYGTYAYDGEGFISPITIQVYHDLLDEFEKYRQSGKLLDVGCGRGYFLTEAKKRGWKVYGTEYSDTAVKICSANGIEMKQGKLNPSDFSEKDFDVITSFEVIEHINNPNEELQNIVSLLRKGGLFYCTTPNFNSLMRYYLKTNYNVIGYPEHLSYYTKSTLTKVTKRNGLQSVKFLSTGISITRIKTSQKKSTERLISQESSDEKLRQQINRKWYLGLTKKLVNWLLTITNTGMSLKGYYVKK